MVKVKAGERKKQLIIQTCKKLFYQYGYTNTTYDMICDLADIAPGSITYHFSSKKDIAALIANEFDMKLREYVSGFVTEEEIGHWPFTSVMIWFRWYLFLNDPNIRRFFAEIYSDYSHLVHMVDLFRLHQQFGMKPRDESDLFLLASTFIGQDRLILNMLEADPKRFSLEQIVYHCEYSLYKLTDLESELTETSIRKGKEVFLSLEDRIELGYFCNFRYQHDEGPQ